MSDDTREILDNFGVAKQYKKNDRWVTFARVVNDIEFNIIKPVTNDYILAIQAMGAIIKLNVMSDRIEGHDGKPIDDFDQSRIFNRLRDYGFRSENRMKDAIKELAWHNRYHPVKQYLESLPEWDGVSRFELLMERLTMTTPKAQNFWRKWFIGAVSKIYENSRVFMLVMIGKQYIGKSSLVRWVCPLENLFYEGPINPDDKDDLIRMAEVWLWEVAELDATTRKRDRAALKHALTQKTIRVRRPYGHYDTIKPPCSSWIGTLNPEGGFLNDTTGNSRFAIVDVQDIDFAYTSIDKDQLWAEIYHAYKSGETWELTPHEREIQEEINKANTSHDPIEEAINSCYRLTPGGDFDETTAFDVLQRLRREGIRGSDDMVMARIGAVMKAAGIDKKRRSRNGKRVWAYMGAVPVSRIADDINI